MIEQDADRSAECSTGSLWRCLLMQIAAPGTAARRTAGVPLRTAWFVHLGACAAGFLAVMILAGLLNRWQGRPLIGSLLAPWEEMARYARRSPAEFWGVAAAVLLALEALVAGLALLLAPWGAGDELLGRSLIHALRQTWLFSVHLAVAVSLATGLNLAMDAAWRARLRQYGRGVQYLDLPWWVQDVGCLVAATWTAGLLWFILALLRGLGARRGTTCLPHPPTCEFCGYDLRAADPAGLCPECGRRVADSLPADHRRGTAWQRRPGWGTWLRTAQVAFSAPQVLGRQLQARTPVTAHRSFAARSFLLLFLCAMPAFLLCYHAENDWRWQRFDRQIWIYGAPAMGLLTAAIGFLAALLAAWAAGAYGTRISGRNALPAAVQVAMYQSPLLLPWALGFYALLFVALAARVGRLPYGPQAVAACALLWLLSGGRCFVLALRGTTAACYANR